MKRRLLVFGTLLYRSEWTYLVLGLPTRSKPRMHVIRACNERLFVHYAFKRLFKLEGLITRVSSLFNPSTIVNTISHLPPIGQFLSRLQYLSGRDFGCTVRVREVKTDLESLQPVYLQLCEERHVIAPSVEWSVETALWRFFYWNWINNKSPIIVLLHSRSRLSDENFQYGSSCW